MNWKCAIAGVAAAMVFAPTLAQADSSLSGVESARAKERQGTYLNAQDRDNLRRYGGNDDYGYGGYYGGYGYGGYGPPVYGGAYYGDGYYGYGPSVGIYIGG
jgi:hypothetical protein